MNLFETDIIDFLIKFAWAALGWDLPGTLLRGCLMRQVYLTPRPHST